MAARAEALEGTVLANRYRILRKLGEGGMGSVYLAEHTTISKRLAVKVLASEYSHKPDLVNRFLQEARAASMIEQENVVEITDFGTTPSGSVFFVMEYLQGEDLAQTLKRDGALPWLRVRAIALQICAALGAAHRAGIIHRDMKPENCYRIRRGNSDDFIKVLDFGIAKVQSEEGEGGRSLTRTGMIFGTPEYMSPEQAKGEAVDPRVDVYAVGVILYELLTGRVPFSADTFMGILTKHMFEAPAAPSSLTAPGAIPVEVEAIILKALQKDRQLRFADMDAMAQAIESVGTGAAPVAVIHEATSAPMLGPVAYAPGTTAPELGTAVASSPASRVRWWGIGGALGGVALGVLVLSLWGNRSAESAASAASDPAHVPSVVNAASEDPSGSGAGQPMVTPGEKADGAAQPADDKAGTNPLAAIVKVTLSSPDLEAGIYSDADGGLLGHTNQPLELVRATDVLAVRVRAPGYEELLLEIVPDANKIMDVSLVPLSELEPPAGTSTRDKATAKRPARDKSASSPAKGQTPAHNGDSKPADSKPADSKAKSKPSKSRPLSDIKDPFNR